MRLHKRFDMMTTKRLYLLLLGFALIGMKAQAQHVSFGPLHSQDSPREDWLLPGDTVYQDGKTVVLAQGFPIQRIQIGKYWQTTDDLGNQSERFQVLWKDIFHQVGLVYLADILHRIETYHMRIEALRYLTLYSVECTTADKENILGIDVNIILVRMLTASLWRYIYHRAFQQLEQALLYSLTAHIAGDRRIVALAGNLVYLVNKHDTFPAAATS